MLMTLSTCITDNGDGYVTVTETDDGNQYLPEGSSLTAKNRFEWEDTASVDVFRLNATTGNILSPHVITLRSESAEAEVPLGRDGWFTSIHIVLPTKSWVYRELDKSGSIIKTYDIVYFTDGSDLYTCVGTTVERSNLDSLLAETGTNTTISRVDSEYMSVAKLTAQVDSEYKSMMENQMYNGGCKSDSCSAKRLSAGLNLIRHYVRIGQLAEAERTIEKLNWFSSNNDVELELDKRRTLSCGCRL